MVSCRRRRAGALDPGAGRDLLFVVALDPAVGLGEGIVGEKADGTAAKRADPVEIGRAEADASGGDRPGRGDAPAAVGRETAEHPASRGQHGEIDLAVGMGGVGGLFGAGRAVLGDALDGAAPGAFAQAVARHQHGFRRPEHRGQPVARQHQLALLRAIGAVDPDGIGQPGLQQRKAGQPGLEAAVVAQLALPFAACRQRHRHHGAAGIAVGGDLQRQLAVQPWHQLGLGRRRRGLQRAQPGAVADLGHHLLGQHVLQHRLVLGLDAVLDIAAFAEGRGAAIAIERQIEIAEGEPDVVVQHAVDIGGVAVLAAALGGEVEIPGLGLPFADAAGVVPIPGHVVAGLHVMGDLAKARLPFAQGDVDHEGGDRADLHRPGAPAADDIVHPGLDAAGQRRAVIAVPAVAGDLRQRHGEADVVHRAVEVVELIQPQRMLRQRAQRAEAALGVAQHLQAEVQVGLALRLAAPRDQRLSQPGDIVGFQPLRGGTGGDGEAGHMRGRPVAFDLGHQHRPDQPLQALRRGGWGQKPDHGGQHQKARSAEHGCLSHVALPPVGGSSPTGRAV